MWLKQHKEMGEIVKLSLTSDLNTEGQCVERRSIIADRT